MPLYFFNVYDGTLAPGMDEIGTDLPDIYSAQAEAIRTSGEILRDIGSRFWNEAVWRMEVADRQGVVLFVLRFSIEERLPDLDDGPDPAGR